PHLPPVHLLIGYQLLQPPTSSFFPYTTLFRSTIIANAWQLSRWPTHENPRPSAIGRAGPREPPKMHVRVWGFLLSFIPAASSWRDRKSTRLNYSHQIISYAVSCLKKTKS